ncbi:MAG: pyridoxal phosphate-dependent aminotransferase [Niabella sp.]|nr:pyridoxal phosphate-dependent aminotransferase [Niabella sp.]
MKLSHLAETLSASKILAISNAVKERVRNGESIHNYTVGDFDPSIFPIPELLEKEIIKAYQNRQTNYPIAEGNPELRGVLSDHICTFQGHQYKPSEILVAAGGRPLIYTTYQVVVDPGDVVIYPVPSWNNEYYAELTGATPCVIHTKAENNFMPTSEEIKPFIRDAVLLALCSPQNPTGTFFTAIQLKAICELVVQENERRSADQKKLYILFDNIYNLLTYSDGAADPVAVCPEVRPYTIYIDAISKGFAATGVRVGWCYGPEPVIVKMKAVLSHMGAWAPNPEQVGLAKFLQEPQCVRDFLVSFRAKLQLRLDRIYRDILKFKAEGLPVDAIAPQASIYLSLKIDIPGDLTSLLLNEAGIAVLPFAVFGAGNAERWYRLSVGTCKEEDITPLLEKFRQVLESSCAVIH